MTHSVVTIEDVAPGIVQITMQDRVSRNAFSLELVTRLMEAVASLNARLDCKVAILTGYDTYFASGGTKDQLLGLHEAQGRLTETPVYNSSCTGALNMGDGILNCEVPIIAAMQGHGIGGGLVLGMYCDLVILSRESIYTANFMRYGFTPGLGATCVLPKKLGAALATELLLCARNYRGADLQARGVPFPVLPRAGVLEHAYELARDLADKPRTSLTTLKRHLTIELREQLPQAISREFAMHDQTLHLPEVRDRIATLYGQ